MTGDVNGIGFYEKALHGDYLHGGYISRHRIAVACDEIIVHFIDGSVVSRNVGVEGKADSLACSSDSVCIVITDVAESAGANGRDATFVIYGFRAA